MPRFVKVGRSFRGVFEGGERNVLLGLVPSDAIRQGGPRLVPLDPHKNGPVGQVEPERVLDAVQQALRDTEAATGVRTSLEAIEYVPNDSAYYEMYYSLACKLLRWIATER